MYNILQPYVNLTNANIETFSRFMNAGEITDLTKQSAIKVLEVAQENVRHCRAIQRHRARRERQ